MFKNMGGKIKGWTKFVCWMGIIISILAGIGMAIAGIQSGDEAAAIISGIAVAVVGFLISWIGSFVAYGFGEMVENSTIQAALMLRAGRALTTDSGALMLREESERRNAPAVPSVPAVPSAPAQGSGSDDDENINDLSTLSDSIKF